MEPTRFETSGLSWHITKAEDATDDESVRLTLTVENGGPSSVFINGTHVPLPGSAPTSDPKPTEISN